jgi:phage terminase small subunit
VAQELTPKQEAFCQKYIELGNASEAYRVAYDAARMKADTVHVKACELLKNGKVAVRVEELQAALRRRHEVTVDRVMREYARLAFLDIRKAFDAEGNLKPVHELDDDTAAAIAGLEVEELRVPGVADQTQEPQGHGGSLQRSRAGTFAGRLKKVKLADKKGALDSLAKHLGMFTDKVEVTGKGGKDLLPARPPTDEELADAVARLDARAAALNDPPETPGATP